MKKVRIKMIWAVMLCLLFVVGCGGGGGGDSQKVIAEAKLSVSPTSHNFDGVVLNNSADQLFTITNNGNFRGVIKFTSTDPQFSVPVDTDKCTGDLAAGENCTFIARFKPDKQGLQRGNISIASNNPAPVFLQGFGHGLNVWINQIFSQNCTAVVFDATVTNPNGALSVLDKTNFTLTQNGVGVSQDDITGFQIIDPDSVSAVLTLDLSESLTLAIGDIKAGAENFINLMTDNDEAAMYKVGSNIKYYPNDLNDPNNPNDDTLFTITDPGGKTEFTDPVSGFIFTSDPSNTGTILYEAVYDSITRASAGSKSTRAVIVLSDGSNRGTPKWTLDEVIKHANDAKVPVFTIYYVDSNWAYDAKPAILKRLAEETGGQDFYANTTTMQIIYSQIWALISKRYRITYKPPSCVVGPSQLQVIVNSAGLTGLDTKIIVFPQP